jgi:hypothetical protein
MRDNREPEAIDARVYFATLALALKWYNYEDLRKLSDLRRTTRAIGYLPIRLTLLLAADTAKMGLVA